MDNDNLDKSKALLYAKSYLLLAKSKKDSGQTIEAYKALLYASSGEESIRYADSMISVAKRTGRKQWIGAAYLTKGITYYKQKKHNQALENYLLADTYIAQTNDPYLIHKLKYSLAETKYLLRHYESAVSLFKECVSFYEKTKGKPWLNSLHHLGLCYTRLKKFDLCTSVNEMGLREAIKSDENSMVVYFTHSEGINQYHRQNYDLALAKLRQSIPGLIQLKDMPNEMVAYFYIAKSFADLGQFKNELPYLLKIDDALTRYHYIRNDLRQGISMLVEHYAKMGNKDLELRYSYHLRKADSILSTDFENISNKVNARKDAKNDSRIHWLEMEKRSERSFWIWLVATISGSAVAIAGFVYYRYLKMRKSFQESYDDLIRNGDRRESKSKPPKYSQLDLTPEKEAELYQNLEEFEKSKNILHENLTQIVVAKHVKTNTKYLIFIIKKYRKKRFVRYINDLKCEYTYQWLANSSKARNFDQQSLAEAVGFGTAQNLRNAFIKRYGFSTPFYIEQLRKNQNKKDENDGQV